jgi:hypothetical protein
MNDTAYQTFQGRLAYYHPNQTGKGCAVRFELRPARRGREGYVFAELARQKSAASRQNGAIQGATFDWESRVAVKLGLTDVCALLTVLEGRVAAAGGDKGLFHQTEGATAVITFRRVEQPFAGYALEVSRKEKGKEGAEPVRLRIGLSEAEGCGLRQVLAAAVFHLCFYETTVFPADADSETL